MKELHCRDVGFDCDGVIRAATEEDVLRQAARHAESAHGLTEIDSATVEQIRSQIQTV
jgi:predicted small metal-binding protein